MGVALEQPIIMSGPRPEATEESGSKEIQKKPGSPYSTKMVQPKRNKEE